MELYQKCLKITPISFALHLALPLASVWASFFFVYIWECALGFIFVLDDVFVYADDQANIAE